MNSVFLGEGREGVVYRHGKDVVKIYHDSVINDEEGARLTKLLKKSCKTFPSNLKFEKENGKWVLRYLWFDSEPVTKFSKEELVDYLISVGNSDIIADNFKYSNLRRKDGRLINIDIGKHVKPFNRSTFRDICGKAFALLNGMTESELISNFENFRKNGSVSEMQGFDEFYREVVLGVAESFWDKCPSPNIPEIAFNVTLLIKCCAMDYAYIEVQVRHIVRQLSLPRRFNEIILLIDSRKNNFLRQHTSGNIDSVRRSANQLLYEGVINRIIDPDLNPNEIKKLNKRWFDVSCEETHTQAGIPVYSQLFAFEQVSTPLVLQADCDVLICRHDHSHDYLFDMESAHVPKDILGVGFNIPHAIGDEFKVYDAAPGEFKPEVRLGLFNLRRLFATLPWPNRVADNYLESSWYQSLHSYMRQNDLRCLRGGDPRSFYIHPLNSAKKTTIFLSFVRNLVESGQIPPNQLYKWDLIEDELVWKQFSFRNRLIFLIYPNHKNLFQLERCVKSFAGQNDKNFIIFVVENLSYKSTARELVDCLNKYGLKYLTINKHTSEIFSGKNKGYDYSHNFIFKHKSDEALMSADAVSQIKEFASLITNNSASCACDEGDFLCSRFNHRSLYGGEFKKIICDRPRCLKNNDSITIFNELSEYDSQFTCATFDLYSEVPLKGGNIRYPVMAGFVLWKESLS